MCTWKPELNDGVFLSCSPVCFLRWDHSQNLPELTYRARAAGQQAIGSPLFVPPQRWNYRCMPPGLAFSVGAEELNPDVMATLHAQPD